jgi:hypothetical protein
MKAENWVIIAGLALALLLLVSAIVPEGWRDGTSPGVVADSATGAPEQNAAALTGTGGGARANADTRKTPAGMVPFSKARTTRFQGKVVRVISLGNTTGWGQLHVWVDDGGGGPSKEISIAPDWFLIHLGCMIKENTRVKGVAFSFGKMRPDPELYVKNITVDGKTCDLRNDEGFALWSNRLR